MNQRIDKINELLKQEVGKIVLKEVDLPGDLLATVTRVDATPNLKNATVYLSILPEKKGQNTLKDINLLIFNIQKTLNRKLFMKPVPKIEFKIDRQAKKEQEIYKVFSENKQE